MTNAKFNKTFLINFWSTVLRTLRGLVMKRLALWIFTDWMYTHIASILPSLQVVCFLNKQKIVGGSYRNVQETTCSLYPASSSANILPTYCTPWRPGNCCWCRPQDLFRVYGFAWVHLRTCVYSCSVLFCNSDFENWSCSASSLVLDIILSDHCIFQVFFPTSLVGVE